MKAKKSLKSVLAYMLVVTSYCLIVSLLGFTGGNEISYSQAMQVIEENVNQVSKIVVKTKSNEVIITIKENEKSIRYTTVVPNTENFIETVMQLKTKNEVSFDISISKTTATYLEYLFKCFFIYLAINWFWKKIFELLENGFKKSHSSSKNEEDEKSESKPKFSINFDKGQGSTTFKDFKKMFSNDFTDEIEEHLVKDLGTNFNDVAGMENAKSALKDVAIGILESGKYEKYGAKIPSGILLEGAPGTGKTLLAKALAGEIKVPFIQYSATEMSTKWAGESEDKVRQIFDYARKNAPCIIFFDEIDSIATSRQKDTASYEKKLLNQLLTCLDGFTPRDGVIFIAATNFVESLDEAIKRPGRFDRIVHVDLPNSEEREEILKVHSRNKKLSSEIDLKELARNTATLSGAYLANILNEAVIIQLKAGHEFITPIDLNEAHRNVLFGPKSTRKTNAEEKHLTAIHELGHAVTSKESIKEISIIPRGSMGGYTWYNYNDESYITASKIKEKLVSFLGGRAAEQVILGEISIGAQNDMERAWKMAYDYITKYGMSDIMGPISINTATMSDVTKEVIFKETKKMISEAFETATKMIREKEKVIKDVSQILENKETILGEEFYEIVKSHNISI